MLLSSGAIPHRSAAAVFRAMAGLSRHFTGMMVAAAKTP
jgi:hypothetical protein